MKSICLILPYFGKLPTWFNKFLVSCKNNPTIDFLIFTDDKQRYVYPKNVKVIYESFENFQKRYENKKLIKPLHPYKLCDYRITYGYVFEEYLVKYDFWGYCDCDLIFGDIRKYVTEKILKNYNKIFTCGHLTILRNNPKINQLFRIITIKQKYDFNYICNDKEPYSCDEWSGISKYFKENKIPQYNGKVIDDIMYQNNNIFRTTREVRYRDSKNLNQIKYNRKMKNIIYRYENGKLYRIYNINNTCKEKEILYVHFQKRKLEDKIPSEKSKYLIAPNYFYELTEENLKVHNIKKVTKYDKCFFRTIKQIEWYVKRIYKKIKKV